MTARYSHAAHTAHATPADLELYVLGALGPGEVARVDRHVRACAACASALADEARLENTLRALVPAVAGLTGGKVVPLPRRAPPPHERPSPPRRAGLSSAVAATVALMAGVWGLGGKDVASRAGGPGRGALGEGAPAAVLACELERDPLLCPWRPAAARAEALRSVEVASDAAGAADICRSPADEACRLQSRWR